MEQTSKMIIVALIAALVVVSGSFAAFAYTVINTPKANIENESVIAPVAANITNLIAPSYLYVQNADSGTLAKQDGAYILMLNGVSSTTVSFTDRPERMAEKISTQDFVDEWSTGPDSFADDPPNAALVIYEGDIEETLVLELQNPVYDTESDILQYDVSFLNSNGVVWTESHGTLEPEGQIPNSFARVALFIDDSAPSYCKGTPPDLPSTTPAAEVGAYGAGYNQGFSDGENCTGYYARGGSADSAPSYCKGTPPAAPSGVSNAEVGAYGAGYNQGFSDGENCMAYYIRGGE